MKKIIFIICAILMSFTSCQNLSQVNSTIQGKAEGVDGKTVYLYKIESDKVLIDTTVVDNGSFSLKVSLPEECFVSVSVGRKRPAELFLEKGTINVILFDRDCDAEITGTPINNLMTSCHHRINVYEGDFQRMIKQRKSLGADQKNEMDAIQKKYSELYGKRTMIIKDCINQNIGNVVGAYFLHTYSFLFSNKEIAEFLSDVPSIMKKHPFIKEVSRQHDIFMRTEVGQKYIDIKLKDVNGNDAVLSDYVGKGKYVLVDFWASWCAPCRGEIPYLKAAYKKFKSKGFEIVGISMDTKKESWTKCLKDMGMTWPQFCDLQGMQSENAVLYGVNLKGIPSIFLIDPDGVIIAHDLRDNEIEKHLSKLLK